MQFTPEVLTLTLILVAVWHEVGHLALARLVGIPVKRLYIGFGPIWLRHKVGADTEIVWRLLPVGMSVAVPGRRDAEGRMVRPLSHDIWMAASGPIASILLMVLAFAFVRFLPLTPPLAIWLVGMGLLSAALGVLNLLPIPGLDGGHLLLLAMAVRGRQLAPKQEMKLQRIGANLLAVACAMPLIVTAWSWFTI